MCVRVCVYVCVCARVCTRVHVCAYESCLSLLFPLYSFYSWCPSFLQQRKSIGLWLTAQMKWGSPSSECNYEFGVSCGDFSFTVNPSAIMVSWHKLIIHCSRMNPCFIPFLFSFLWGYSLPLNKFLIVLNHLQAGQLLNSAWKQGKCLA